MRLGDTGLVVDYVVSKLSSMYPEMDSGELVSWSSENTNYLKVYLQENMPEMLQMLNISSTAQPFSTLFLDTDGTLKLTELNTIMKKEYVATVGEIIDTNRGSPYDEYPLKIISIPVEAKKKYRLAINYNDAISEAVNFTNPDGENWSLVPYALVGVSKGRLLYEGQPLRGCIIGSSESSKYRLLPPVAISPNPMVPIREEKSYIKILSDYSIKFDQTVNISSVDKLRLTPGTFNVSEIALAFNATRNLVFSYDNVREIAYINYEDNNDPFIIHPGLGDPYKNALLKDEYITLNTAGLQILKGGIGSPTDLKAEIKNLKLGVGSLVVAGIVVGTSLRVTGYSTKKIDSPCTGLDLLIYTTSGSVTTAHRWFFEEGSSTLSYTQDGNTTAMPTLNLSAGSFFFMDGLEYAFNSNFSTANMSTRVAITSNYESHEPNRLLTYDLIINEFTDSQEPYGRSIKVNKDAEGYNLIIQLPNSTVSYSLVEINENDDMKVDMTEFSEGSVVTSSYLDAILLDRTITKYSQPDDIEWLQQLSGFYNPSLINDELPLGIYLGVFDTMMREKIKQIQRDKTVSMRTLPDGTLVEESNGLGRDTYITGWCDPETELFLEIRYGY